MRRTLATLAALAVAVTAALFVSTPASAASTLRFHGAQYDSPGQDTGSNASRNLEWISLVNYGSQPVHLNGYTIRDRANHVYTFGHITIAARGGRVWLRTGRAWNSGRVVYWGRYNYVWNNSGDTAYLRRPSGATIDTCSWGYMAYRTYIAC